MNKEKLKELYIESTRFCEKEFKNVPGPVAWVWEEKFAELIIEECMEIVIGCDDPKMILHEPYKTIVNKLSDFMNGIEYPE